LMRELTEQISIKLLIALTVPSTFAACVNPCPFQ
jgi:hypothetical protein